MKRLNARQAATAVAAALGVVALLGDPYGGGVVTIDARELGRIVETKQDHVAAPELADWILQGRTDFRLIDVREAEAYAEYHIPGAEHVPLSALADYGFYRNEKIALYSDGGIHAAQAWMLLKALGYPGVYTVLGGLDAWKEEVLFPAPPPGSEAEALAAFERAREVAQHFGGSPRVEGGERAEIGVELPRVEPPAATFAPTARKKKRKEGC
ncbi:MAG: rhodanese-like domain-containing protein [bacterium]|nr:rhodanese-like domain-containing protein [bacterium]